MPKRINTDHVVVDIKDHGVWKCLHCGARHMPTLPMELRAYCEAMKGFTLMHKRCLPNADGKTVLVVHRGGPKGGGPCQG